MCLVMIRNTYTSEQKRAQNSNNDQHNYNAVYIPCHKRAETLPKYEHNDLAQKDMKIQSVHLVRNAHSELERFQTSGTMVYE